MHIRTHIRNKYSSRACVCVCACVRACVRAPMRICVSRANVCTYFSTTLAWPRTAAQCSGVNWLLGLGFGDQHSLSFGFRT